MLNEADVSATIAVKDIEVARKFYGSVLGLQEISNDPGGITYRSGGTKLFVYPSAYAGTNQATSAAWSVTNLDAIVAELKSKGVVFEQYDLPGATREGEVHTMGNMKALWFKDPEGNILALDNLASSR
jgi:catechol-2,3-dioxygenase